MNMKLSSSDISVFGRDMGSSHCMKCSAIVTPFRAVKRELKLVVLKAGKLVRFFVLHTVCMRLEQLKSF